MKTIKRFINNKRIVKLTFDESDKTYTVSLLTLDGKYTGKIYKSKFYAEKKFSEYQNYPLNEIKGLK